MKSIENHEPVTFDRFDLHSALLRGVDAAGFETARPIQVATIPAALEGQDILGLAQTGTGKTAAFALPLLDELTGHRHKATRALILAPTRELATQIAAEISLLSRFTKVKLAIIFGGVPQHKQVSILRSRPEIVVGCPGRVLDLVEQGLLRLDQVETLVLDEADHMFDMGFLPTIRRILRALPSDRQNLMFSATMPKEIRHLADDILRDPHVVELNDSAPAALVDHGLVHVVERRKRELLDHFLDLEDCKTAIVFTRTKHRARRLAEQLSKAGRRAVALQGNMSQSQRDRAMAGFRSRRFDILVATDVAARGIDVSGVTHVLNFDVPTTPEAYTHRIGRTGRSEQSGIACTFVTREDHAWLRATEKMIGSAIRREKIAGFESDVQVEASEPHSKSRSQRTYRSRSRSGSQGSRRGQPSRGRRRSRSA